MMNKKKDILIIMGRYLPGYKDGGPVRSIKNLVDYLGEEYNFKILTCDRDHGDTKPYPNIRNNDWNRVGNADVYYVSPGGFTRKLIIDLSNKSNLVYICGCFNDYAINTLVANRFGKIKVPVVVAAMGLFSPMEFRLKYKKKKIFIVIFNMLGMFDNVFWSATSEMEITEIRQQVHVKKENFFIAEDLPRKVNDNLIIKEKQSGTLNVVWISRIAPKKNLLGAIRILQKVRANVNFTVYGPIHDDKYWDECKKEFERLPGNIIWKWEGNVDSEQVVDTLKTQHVFLFPTLGENFGHVIQEALSAGCPCIISDQTPWCDLETLGVGYVFPLDNIQPYIHAIEKYADMDSKSFQKVVNKAHDYAKRVSNSKAENTGYRRIFDKGWSEYV